MYGFLEACQGRLVPVNLGTIALSDKYWTECGAPIPHMMQMSFAGESLWHHSCKTDNQHPYREEMLRTLCELMPYGVVHDDVNNNNMVWNEEMQRVMAIDFDYARIDAAVHAHVQPKGRPEQEQEQEPASRQLKRKEMLNEQVSSQQAKRVKADVVVAKENVLYEG